MITPGLRHWALIAALLAPLTAMLACARPVGSENSFWSISRPGQATAAAAFASGGGVESAWGLPTRRPPGAPIYTPTPDAPHALPALRSDAEQYTVQPGDTLGQIASRYGVSIEQIVRANELPNPDILSVGQVITIPAPTPESRGPAFKIIPDSELVYGPASVLTDVDGFVRKQGGYLASYREQLGEQTFSGAQIVQFIAQDYSVNPRLLLAVLEHQSGWVTKAKPAAETSDYPMGWADPQRKGLYRQLAWAANNLNRGYYLWRVGGVGAWLLSDDTIVPADPTINAGTAGVQHLYSLLYDRLNWEKAVSSGGLFATYNTLFGYPFDYAVEPLVPPDLVQPVMQLPFEPGQDWAFTGGPHGAWGDGSAWAALDFAPPGEALGCVDNDAWVTAVAPGLVVRSDSGVVILDLDGDGLEQTGWVVLYLHIASRERVAVGTYLQAGERIGYASCEGGVSSGTHVHLARRYNGEWIAADQDIPFILDGWIASGAGKEYDGYLQRGAQKIEAYAGRSENNGIQR